MNEHVKTLIEKASKAEDAGDAMKFSQAACNAANALQVLAFTEIAINPPKGD